MSEDFNMTMRKYLKRVGVTSQQVIEAAMRDAGAEKTSGREYAVRVVLTIDDLELEHVVDGKISGPD